MNTIKRKLKDGRENLKREVKEKTTGYILAALGFVVGLAWNDAMKTLIEYLFPLNKDSILIKLFYAFFITIVTVLITVYFLKSTEENPEKLEKK
jgi:hypothetical protein